VSDEQELPRGVALAWGVAAAPQRGPKRELSIERIVEVAAGLADAGGLSAVSMSAIAGELGVTPMALYRYVSAKDDLVLLMNEEGIGVPPETVAEAEGWRAGLAAWTDAIAERYREHPWLLDIPIQGTPSTPNDLAWLDAALAVLEPTPFGDGEKLAVSLMLIAQARWEGFIARGFDAALAGGQSPEELDAQWERMMGPLVTADRFPHVAPLVARGAFGAEQQGDPFAFARESILDGLVADAAAREAGAPPRVVAGQDPADPALKDPKYREAVKARREQEKRLREARAKERETLRHARERLAR
jgi:AcrR family transcriptional regulator